MTSVAQQDAVRANKVFYENYWSHPWKYRLMYDMQIKKKLFLFALRRTGIEQHGKRVLDIGFGSGEILFTFEPSCEIYGVDFSRNAVDGATRYAAKKGYRSAEFLPIDLDRDDLPFPDGGFDVVISSHTLEHLVDDERILKEMRRTLKDEGVAVIVIPINEGSYIDPHHVRRYTIESFRGLTKALDFQVIYERENEYLWNIAGGFFLKNWHRRIRLLGPLVSGLFNVPLALLPIQFHFLIDRTMKIFGFPPRQAVFVLKKSGTCAESPA